MALASALMGSAQTDNSFAIRVETNEVLVPTIVYQKEKMSHVNDVEQRCSDLNARNFWSLSLSEAYLPDDCDQGMIRGLGTQDFHVFEDGAEQKIDKVSIESRPIIIARDNYGNHNEWSWTARGKWSSPDLGARFGPRNASHFYVISYAPPPAKEGSCHKVRVVVDNAEASVFARDIYCSSVHPESDPLRGTDLEKRAEAQSRSKGAGKIPLSVQAGYFYTAPGKARVHLTVEFPWRLLKREWKSGQLHANIGVLGTVYGKNGELQARFSDFACCASELPIFLRSGKSHADVHAAHPELDPAYLPTRYETQLDLAPGTYDLQIVLTDNKEFGRVRMPLKIEDYDGHKLAISSALLCTRFRNADAAAREAAGANLAPAYVPLVNLDLQMVPVGNLRFRGGELVMAYFEAYPFPEATEGKPVQFQMRVVNAKTNAVVVGVPSVDENFYLQPGSRTITIAREVALATLPQGQYRLEVQATDSLGRSTPWRATSFTIAREK
jgi:hypothetical protein